MKRFTQVLVLMLALIFIGLVNAPALAQDGTDTVVDATAVPDDPSLDATDNAPAPLPQGTVLVTVTEIFLGLITAASAGGLVGVMGIGVLADRLRRNEVTIAAIEKLGDQVPPETANKVIDLANQVQSSVDSVAKLLSEALDKIPAASKPQIAAATIPRSHDDRRRDAAALGDTSA